MERRHEIINKQEEYSLNIGRAYVEYAPESSYIHWWFQPGMVFIHAQVRLYQFPQHNQCMPSSCSNFFIFSSIFLSSFWRCSCWYRAYICAIRCWCSNSPGSIDSCRAWILLFAIRGVEVRIDNSVGAGDDVGSLVLTTELDLGMYWA